MTFQVGRFLRRGSGNPESREVPQAEGPNRDRVLFSIPQLPETNSPALPAISSVASTRGSIRQNAMKARAAIRRRTLVLMFTSVGVVLGVFLVFHQWRPGTHPVTRNTPKIKKSKPADIMARKPEVLRLPEEESGPMLTFPSDHNPSEPSAKKMAVPHAPIIPVAGDNQLEPYHRPVKWAFHTRDSQAPPRKQFGEWEEVLFLPRHRPSILPSLRFPRHIARDRTPRNMSLLDRAIVKAYRETHSQPVSRPQPAAVEPAPVVIPPTKPQAVEPVESVARGWNWPRITQQLLNQSEAGFQHLARQLLGSAAERHEKCVAFFGTTRGEGCSSVLLTLAHVLARLKQPRILLVDADLEHPSLWSQLQPGSASTHKALPAAANRPLMLSGSNVCVLAPVEKAPPDQIPEHLSRLTGTLAEVRDQFDLILIDAGVLVPDQTIRNSWLEANINAAIAVISSRQRTASSLESDEDRRWTEAGISWLGMIETFA